MAGRELKVKHIKLELLSLKLEQVEELIKKISVLRVACLELKWLAETKLGRIFEVILAVGNYMNGGTDLGCTCGFRLSSCLALVHIQGTNPGLGGLKYSLLDFGTAFS